MPRTASILSFIGTFFLLLGLSNSLFVAQGSSGHWGYLIAIQDEPGAGASLPAAQEEIALQGAATQAPLLPDRSPTPAEDGSGNLGGDEISVPVDITPQAEALVPDPTPAQREMAQLQPGIRYVPERLSIPAIELDAPIVEAKYRFVRLEGQKFQQWLPPSRFAAGWHASSVSLGTVGNTVLNGHNNLYGGVFDRLRDLQAGDRVYVTAQELVFVYEITNVMNLPEKYESLRTRLANAQWLQPSQDERLTLVTCWPPNHNTNRLIVVARPVDRIEVGVSGQPTLKP